MNTNRNSVPTQQKGGDDENKNMNGGKQNNNKTYCRKALEQNLNTDFTSDSPNKTEYRNFSPEGANACDSDILATLSNQVQEHSSNNDELHNLLPQNNLKGGKELNTVHVADPKLIRTERHISEMSTKKSGTHDFRGDIPIKKDNNVLWNMSTVEPFDLIQDNKSA